MAHGRRGMSLIELLVVMVILTIGIFAIIQIFPQGFRFINHARNVTLAGRLAQGEVERLKGAAANLPDGIEAEDVANGGIWTNYNPNDMSNADPAHLPPSPTADDLWHWSNVNRTRLVRGETTLIPSPMKVPQGKSLLAYSIYNLKFAPVEFGGSENAHPLPPGGAWPDQYVLIYGDPIPRVNVTGLQGDALDNALDDLNRYSYAIDYTAGKVYFPRSYTDRVYKVSYNYWGNGTLLNTTEILNVPASATWGSQLPDGADIATLAHVPDDYSEQISRKFKYVASDRTGTPFSKWDPYEFTILNSYLGTAEFAPTIGFNPRGANRTARTNLGTRPLRAHIDYEVADWHVIHEDRTVPSPSTQDPNGYEIRLTVPGVKVAGRNYNDVSVVGSTSTAASLAPYGGLTAGLNGYSVVALDLTDNTLILNNTNGGDTGLSVDYTRGIVTIPANVTKYTPFGDVLTGQDVRGHMVRLFYQAVGDWAVQVTKAWSSYQRMTASNGLDKLQYNNFSAEIVGPSAVSTTQPGAVLPPDMWCAVLSFPRSNAGQSVSVSFIWSDVNNVPHEVTGRQFKLTEFARLDTAYPYIVVPFAKDGQYAMPAANQQWNNPRFTFVNGASVKVRVIWREDPRRWESRDLETFLTREQSDEDNS